METYTLSNGVTIPKIGFGTWQIPEGEEAYNSVSFALKAGYTHIDTAQIYGNEVSVGKAIADSDVAREDIFLTTKLWNDKHDYDLAKASIDESLERLGVDYLDLLLIHWPNPKALRETDAWKVGNAGAWKAMEEAYKDGKVRAIGLTLCSITLMLSLKRLKLCHMSIKFFWLQVVPKKIWLPIAKSVTFFLKHTVH